MKSPIPAAADWVTERSKCTPAQLFVCLGMEVEKDVEIRNAIGGAAKFDFTSDGDRFVVGRTAAGQPPQAVTFTLRERGVTITSPATLAIELSTSLCDDGICRLCIHGMPLELWQVRRRSLERLFFE